MLINVYALSKLWYFTYIVPLSSYDIKLLEIRSTLWNSKALISLKHLHLPFSEGGLNLTNVKIKMESQKIMWGFKIFNATQNFGKLVQNFLKMSFKPLPPWLNNGRFKSTKSNFFNDIMRSFLKFIAVKSKIINPNAIIIHREGDTYLKVSNLLYKFYKSINTFKPIKSKKKIMAIKIFIERAIYHKSENIIHVKLLEDLNLSTSVNLPNLFCTTSKNNYNDWKWHKNLIFNDIYHTVLCISYESKFKMRKYKVDFKGIKEEVLFIKKLKVKPTIKDFLYKRIFNANP
jgi:hypothetical protein